MGGGEERSGVDGWGVGKVGERERDGCPDRIINAAGATALPNFSSSSSDLDIHT